MFDKAMELDNKSALDSPHYKRVTSTMRVEYWEQEEALGGMLGVLRVLINAKQHTQSSGSIK